MATKHADSLGKKTKTPFDALVLEEVDKIISQKGFRSDRKFLLHHDLGESLLSKIRSGVQSAPAGLVDILISQYHVNFPHLGNSARKAFGPYPAGQNNVHASGLLSHIPMIELPHISFKARASFNYAQLQRYKSTDIFDTVLHRLPPNRTPEDYKDAVVFDIEGDSMEPSLRDGQQVIAWPVPEAKWEYLHNTACVVDYDETVTIKAIYKNDLNNMGGLTLHATGGPGGSFVVARKDIHSIWEVREFYGIVPFRLLP